MFETQAINYLYTIVKAKFLQEEYLQFLQFFTAKLNYHTPDNLKHIFDE